MWRESERMREASDASEERFRRAFDDAPVAIALVSPRGQVLQGNRELCERTGHVHPEGLLLWDFVPEHDRVALAQSWPPEPDAPEVERRYVRADGSIGWFLWRHSLIRDAAGQPDHWVFQGVDITARKRDAERLDHQAHHDALTELPNRARFDELLEGALAPRPRRRRDLRRPRRLQGHQRLARAPHGRRAARRGRPSASPPSCGPTTCSPASAATSSWSCSKASTRLDDARRTANRLAAALKEPFELGGHERFLTASFGIAFGERAAREALLRDADAAMYHAKDQGKARLEVFDDSLRARALERLEIEAGLREAIASGQLELLLPARDPARGRLAVRHGGAAALAAPGARDDLPRDASSRSPSRAA